MEIVNKRITSKNIKKVMLTVLLMLFISVTLTGCQKVKETFGKEYRMIDNAFEQLEADLVYSFEEYAKAEGFTEQEWNERQIYVDQCIAEVRVAKNEMKNWLRDGQNLQQELGTNIDVEDYINKALIEFRIEIDEGLREKSDGAITLKSTKVKRGLVGSVWYFVRNHWLITLIILGIIGNIYEKIEEANLTDK